MNRKVHFALNIKDGRTMCGMRRQAMMGFGGASETVDAEGMKVDPVTCLKCLTKLNRRIAKGLPLTHKLGVAGPFKSSGRGLADDLPGSY